MFHSNPFHIDSNPNPPLSSEENSIVERNGKIQNIINDHSMNSITITDNYDIQIKNASFRISEFTHLLNSSNDCFKLEDDINENRNELELNQDDHINTMNTNDDLYLNRIHNQRQLREESKICWLVDPDIDWNISWYFEIRGAESLHLYLWVLKDLSWVQDWYMAGHIFGILAILWGCFILSHAVHYRNIKEIWTTIGQILWLFANLWWMMGEIHDDNYPSDTPIYEQRMLDARYIMLATIIWFIIYYSIIKPCKICYPTITSEAIYDNTGLTSRIPLLLRTWREYENIHIVFWLCKDYAWNILNPILWIIFVIPTLIIAFDFVFITLYQQELLIEHCHYIAQLLWVYANIVWAQGEIFYPLVDKPYGLFSM